MKAPGVLGSPSAPEFPGRCSEAHLFPQNSVLCHLARAQLRTLRPGRVVGRFMGSLQRDLGSASSDGSLSFELVWSLNQTEMSFTHRAGRVFTA